MLLAIEPFILSRNCRSAMANEFYFRYASSNLRLNFSNMALASAAAGFSDNDETTSPHTKIRIPLKYEKSQTKPKPQKNNKKCKTQKNIKMENT